jgi:hypothetical protein
VSWLATPPAVCFHRFFQCRYQPPVRPEDPDSRLYRGRLDLSRLGDPTLESLLLGIQTSFNDALRDEKQNVAEHVPHPPFHFDFIDSDIPNALAFQYGGYSFIGVTAPLIYMVWDVCLRLSSSGIIKTLLGVKVATSDGDPLHVVLFRTLLNFVVSHEYTHHVHGHVRADTVDAVLSNEVLDEGERGSLDQQTLEADADGYAVFQVLANLIDGAERAYATKLLNLSNESTQVQDQVLFSSVVITTGGYFYVRPPALIDAVRVYTLTHPPQAARMDCVMRQALSWCRQNRPRLAEWMQPDIFGALMAGVAEAALGIDGGTNWAAQTAFLRGGDGAAYIKALDSRVQAHIQALGSRASQSPHDSV